MGRGVLGRGAGEAGGGWVIGGGWRGDMPTKESVYGMTSPLSSRNRKEAGTTKGFMEGLPVATCTPRPFVLEFMESDEAQWRAFE